MFDDFTTLRYEVNYFLSIIETACGNEFKRDAEEELNYILISFFFPKTNTGVILSIRKIENYFNVISNYDTKDYSILKNNLPTIYKMFNIIKIEQGQIK